MKIAVTGAGGYIGAHVVDEAISRGHEVIAVDINLKNISDKAIKKSLDIFGVHHNLFEALGKPDVLIHLAWRDGFIHNSEQHMQNLSSHINFIRDFVKSGGKNVAIMGSMHEIGYHEGAVDENTPTNPQSHYGIAKNAMRESLLLATEELGFNLCWLRAYYIFGDDEYGSSIFSKLTRAAKNGDTTFPFTTGKNLYDFIHVKDLAKMIVAASVQNTVTGVINVATGRATSLADQVEWFIEQNGWDIKLEYGVFPDRPYDSPGIWADATRIEEIMRNYD
ncbi:NAD(P)-dependent oxidoreductase [Lactococcus piscium]|uniref:NAD-dependent epimerase/dehydratase family protein n=1 Tax=Pseudolactococcus carnosus TaxID=2749961 RepID=UPI001FB9A081|nr:NAD(P)-dependent oxidoreductase [Lactococcus carnosus]MCJ1996246.1 NAD(P)-dependent oxidoreductase [Lactococcus carnosus]